MTSAPQPQYSGPEGPVSTPPKGVKKLGLLSALGPGLITGASDDDPSGIATYSQVGAQFGFGQLWIMLFSYPLMAGIQEVSALIGRVTGRGIAGNLRLYYHPFLLYSMVFLVFAANVLNIGADLNAMGAGAALLAGGPVFAWAAAFALIITVLEIFVAYDRYTRYLKWMCLALMAYVATLCVVHVPWGAALKATVIPSIRFSGVYITSIVAVLGTTISPYLFFWQAEEEVEVERASPTEHPLRIAPREAKAQMKRIGVDTYLGMAFSNIVAFFIMLTAAVTLHAKGVTDVASATDAAKALEPIAGKFAFLLFTVGIVGTGLLAVPVLAGSAAYAVGEAFHWRVGLLHGFRRARRFYTVLALSIVLGLGMSLLKVNPMKALFWSAVVNGVVAPPIMILMMRMSSNPNVMGDLVINRRQRILGWTATAVMLAAAVALFAFWGK